MKVMQVVLAHAFYGGERVVYNLSKGLMSAGVEVVLVTTSALEHSYAELNPSRLYALPGYESQLSRRIFIYLRWLIQLREIIRTESPDIVHVHSVLARDMMILINPQCFVVETLHGVGIARGEAAQRLIHTVADPLAALSSDGAIFYNTEDVDNYSRLRLSKPNTVIYNPVDEEFIALVSKPMDAPVKGRYILWCGRLNRIKGADLLLRAFATLNRTDLKLILLSDGPDRAYLEGLVKSLGIEGSTTFLGYTDETTKARYFQHASIICVNLTHPGLSQALMEAMSAGNPVVTGYAPHVYDLFGSHIGLLRTRSVSELAALLAGDVDSTLNSTSGREILQKRFSVSAFAQKHIQFYEQVIGRSS